MYIEGKLKTRKWKDKDGQDRYTTEIVADEMKMLGKREGMGGDGPRENSAPAEGAARKPAAQPAAAPGNFNDFDDDIPF